MRSMAGDFQKQFNEAMREAELDDVKKSVDELRRAQSGQPRSASSSIRSRRPPADVRAGLDAAMRPTQGRRSRPAPAVASCRAAEERRDGMPETAGSQRLTGGASPIDAAAPKRMRPPPVVAANAERQRPRPIVRPSRRSASTAEAGDASPPRSQGAGKPRKPAAQPSRMRPRRAANRPQLPRSRPSSEETSRKTAREPEDDEIEKSSAPLIEHLIELRSRLMWSIGGFFVAFLVCFFFAKQLFNLLVIPFKWAVELGRPRRPARSS